MSNIVAIVGRPNVGKSTLLSAISAAKPKIANYPFTTLEPNIGIVPYREGKSFVMADIPGIIEGASEGKGLGLRFLRHIERNSLLLFIIPVDADDIVKSYVILLNELAKFNPEMLDKQRVLAITKCDTVDDELMELLRPNMPNVPHVFISGLSGMGLSELKDILWRELNDERNKLEPQIDTARLVHRSKDVNDLNKALLEAGDDFEYEYDDIEELSEDDFDQDPQS